MSSSPDSVLGYAGHRDGGSSNSDGFHDLHETREEQATVEAHDIEHAVSAGLVEARQSSSTAPPSGKRSAERAAHQISDVLSKRARTAEGTAGNAHDGIWLEVRNELSVDASGNPSPFLLRGSQIASRAPAATAAIGSKQAQMLRGDASQHSNHAPHAANRHLRRLKAGFLLHTVDLRTAIARNARTSSDTSVAVELRDLVMRSPLRTEILVSGLSRGAWRFLLMYVIFLDRLDAAQHTEPVPPSTPKPLQPYAGTSQPQAPGLTHKPRPAAQASQYSSRLHHHPVQSGYPWSGARPGANLDTTLGTHPQTAGSGYASRAPKHAATQVPGQLLAATASATASKEKPSRLPTASTSNKTTAVQDAQSQILLHSRHQDFGQAHSQVSSRAESDQHNGNSSRLQGDISLRPAYSVLRTHIAAGPDRSSPSSNQAFHHTVRGVSTAGTYSDLAQANDAARSILNDTRGQWVDFTETVDEQGLLRIVARRFKVQGQVGAPEQILDLTFVLDVVKHQLPDIIPI